MVLDWTPDEKARLLDYPEATSALDLEEAEAAILRIYTRRCKAGGGPIGTGWWGRSGCECYGSEAYCDGRRAIWLEGYAPTEMPSELASATKKAVATAVNAWLGGPEEAEHLESRSEGEISVTYREPDSSKRSVPDRALRFLSRFDNRPPIYSLP